MIQKRLSGESLTLSHVGGKTREKKKSKSGEGKKKAGQVRGDENKEKVRGSTDA